MFLVSQTIFYLMFILYIHIYIGATLAYSWICVLAMMKNGGINWEQNWDIILWKKIRNKIKSGKKKSQYSKV